MIVREWTVWINQTELQTISDLFANQIDRLLDQKSDSFANLA